MKTLNASIAKPSLWISTRIATSIAEELSTCTFFLKDLKFRIFCAGLALIKAQSNFGAVAGEGNGFY